MWISGHHHAYYPGIKENIKFVSLSCLGGGSRKLIGDTKVSPKGILKIKIKNNGIQIDGLDVKQKFKTIKRDTLPKSIGRGRHLLKRDDID